MTFNNPGLRLPHGFTDCLICGRAIRDTPQVARDHIGRCDAFGNAR